PEATPAPTPGPAATHAAATHAAATHAAATHAAAAPTSAATTSHPTGAATATATATALGQQAGGVEFQRGIAGQNAEVPANWGGMSRRGRGNA
ncbi:MAG: hypothetical protein ACK6D3_16700, partial [Planctomycetaceae bacterium]